MERVNGRRSFFVGEKSVFSRLPNDEFRRLLREGERQVPCRMRPSDILPVTLPLNTGFK